MTLVTVLSVLQDSSDIINDDALTGTHWLRAGAIFVGSIVLAVVVAQVLRRAVEHAIGPGYAAIVTARLASYLTVLVGLFYALTALEIRVGPLLGALGLGGLVLALALQRVVENFVSSVILQSRRPFTVGDTVVLDGRTGIVTDIDSRVTVLKALDGTEVRVPNANVVSETITNLTRSETRRSTLPVGVAYDSNLQVAHQAIRDALDRVPRVLEQPPPMVNVTGFDESSIGFSVMYWHASDVPSELAARTDVAIAIHQALDAEGITIAFPQMVLWDGGQPDQPYDELAESVSTEYPKTKSSDDNKRRSTPLLRRAVRRK